MTPKEKAEQLIDRMSKQTYQYQEYAGARYTICEIGYEGGKKCVLIAVDEILETLPKSEYLEDRGEYHENRELIYWKQVKQEIEKL